MLSKSRRVPDWQRRLSVRSSGGRAIQHSHPTRILLHENATLLHNNYQMDS